MRLVFSATFFSQSNCAITMKFDLGVTITALSALTGWLMWWLDRRATEKERFKQEQERSKGERQEAERKAAGAATKEYAAQRDFNHLQNDYKQLNQNVEFFIKEQDTRFDRLDLSLTEIKALLLASLQRESNK